MTDYSPKYVTTKDVRNMTNPPLDYNDVLEAEILLKIEISEKYIEAVYELTSSADVRIPALLLTISKIVLSPSLAKKHYTLSNETLGDYSYSLAQPISRGTDIQSSPYVISKTYEKMATEMLRMSSAKKDYKLKIYISNA